jgi:hypothetical protein
MNNNIILLRAGFCCILPPGWGASSNHNHIFHLSYYLTIRSAKFYHLIKLPIIQSNQSSKLSIPLRSLRALREKYLKTLHSHSGAESAQPPLRLLTFHPHSGAEHAQPLQLLTFHPHSGAEHAQPLQLSHCLSIIL